MISQTGKKQPFRLLRDHRRRDVDLALDRIAVAALACWPWQLGELMRRGTPIRADTQWSSISASSAKSRALAARGLLHTVLIWLGLVALAGCAAGPRPDYPRTPSTA